jgi:hypothetical protein
VAWFDPSYLETPPPLAGQIRALPYATRIYHPKPITDALQSDARGTMEDFLFLKNFLIPSYGMAFGIREVRSYQVLRLKKAESYQRRLFSDGPASPLLRWAGVSAYFALNKGSTRASQQTVHILPSPYPCPPLFLPEEGRNDKIHEVLMKPGFVRATVDLPQARTLIFSEVDYPTWHVFIDGNPVPHQLFESTFVAAPIPAGKHAVQFQFDSMSFKTGGFLTLGVVLTGLLRGRRRKSGQLL